MSKHTPGPWFVDEANPDLVQIANGDYICEVNPFSFSLSNHDEEQCEANARLIAGAPELLDAADNALNTLIACCVPAGGVDDRRTILEAQQMLRAAITKVTGEHNDN